MTKENKDGASKNLDVVREEFEELREELATVGARLEIEWKKRDFKNWRWYYELFHIASNYVGEPIDKLPRFWLYVWLVRWPPILFFTVVGVRATFGGE